MWRNFETPSRLLAESLKDFLRSKGIYFEASGGVGFWHFEIACTDKEESAINKWLSAHSRNGRCCA